MLGGGLESVLTITAGLKQVIEILDELLPIYSHGYPSIKNFAIPLPLIVAAVFCVDCRVISSNRRSAGISASSKFSRGRSLAIYKQKEGRKWAHAKFAVTSTIKRLKFR